MTIAGHHAADLEGARNRFATVSRPASQRHASRSRFVYGRVVTRPPPSLRHEMGVDRSDVTAWLDQHGAGISGITGCGSTRAVSRSASSAVRSTTSKSPSPRSQVYCPTFSRRPSPSSNVRWTSQVRRLPSAGHPKSAVQRRWTSQVRRPTSARRPKSTVRRPRTLGELRFRCRRTLQTCIPFQAEPIREPSRAEPSWAEPSRAETRRRGGRTQESDMTDERRGSPPTASRPGPPGTARGW